MVSTVEKFADSGVRKIVENADKYTVTHWKMMDFKALDSLSEQIARHIGNLIITGELKPGDRIQELRIASELNVSRGSVREAYLILERRYLIEIMPRKGAVVSALTPQHVQNMYEMNTLLLSLLVKKAALNWQQEDLQPFLDLVQDMGTYVQRGQVQKFYDSTFEFIHLAYKFAQNNYLVEMLNDLQPSIHRTYYIVLQQGQNEMEASLKFFQEVMEKINARDAEGAVKALERFGEHQCRLVLDQLAKTS